jgi:uncharacterized membrane protein
VSSKIIHCLGYAACVCVIGLSIFFRFYALNGGSYWFDELYSVQLAKRTPIELLTSKFFDPGNPPLHVMLLSSWMSIFGEGETQTRSMSGVLSVISIAVFYVLTKHNIRNTLVRLIVTTLYAVSWIHIWGARETRYYSLLQLLSTWTLLLYLNAVTNTTWRNMLLLTVVSVLGLYTHYSFSILIFALIVAWVFFVRSWKIWVFCYVIYCSFTYILISRIYSPALFMSLPVIQSLELLLRYDVSSKLLGQSINLLQFIELTLYSVPGYLRFIFVLMCVASLIFAYIKKELAIKEQIAILVCVLMIIISFFTPMNKVVNNWYYYFYLTPVLFFVFGICISKLRYKRKMSVGAIMVAIFLYSNTAYLVSYQTHLSPWHIDQFVVDVLDQKVGSIMFGDSDVQYIAIYYFMRRAKYVSQNINVYPQIVLNIMAKPFVFIGYENNMSFWSTVKRQAILDNLTFLKQQSYGSSVIAKYYTY